MNVKCPKCRYRFDVPSSPGMVELQCNCPRCGTPFTFAIGDDELGESSEEAPAADEQTAVSVGQSQIPETAVPNDTPMPPTPDNDHSTVVPPTIPPRGKVVASPVFQDTRKIYGNNGTAAQQPPHRKSHGCLIGCVATVALAMLVVVGVLVKCGSSESYTANDLEISDTAASGTEVDPVSMPTPSYDSSAAAEKAPKWIQGNWHVDTDYGGISLKIHGDQVAETSGGETSYGSYKYQNHRLYCDFGDNEQFVYRLVEETRQIDAGNGLLMKKVD